MPQQSPFLNPIPTSSALGLSAATVIKSGGGKLYGYVTQTALTGAAFYDQTTTTVSGVTNEMLVPTATAGTVVMFSAPLPFFNGLVLGGISGGIISVFYS